MANEHNPITGQGELEPIGARIIALEVTVCHLAAVLVRHNVCSRQEIANSLRKTAAINPSKHRPQIQEYVERLAITIESSRFQEPNPRAGEPGD